MSIPKPLLYVLLFGYFWFLRATNVPVSYWTLGFGVILALAADEIHQRAIRRSKRVRAARSTDPVALLAVSARAAGKRVPRSATKPVAQRTILDQDKEDAALALVSLYRMPRTAAVAALERSGWTGHPDAAAMVVAALAASHRTRADE